MTFRCMCCDRLWNSNGIKRTTFVHESVEHCFDCKSEFGYSVGHSYDKSLKLKKVPVNARINGFRYPAKPDLPISNKVEERLISPRLPFLQIRKLGICGQYGLKGNIINVPVKVDQMVKCLPRQMENDCTINVHLKKKLSFKSSSLTDFVNIVNIKKWLEFLIN